MGDESSFAAGTPQKKRKQRRKERENGNPSCGCQQQQQQKHFSRVEGKIYFLLFFRGSAARLGMRWWWRWRKKVGNRRRKSLSFFLFFFFPPRGQKREKKETPRTTTLWVTFFWPLAPSTPLWVDGTKFSWPTWNGHSPTSLLQKRTLFIFYRGEISASLRKGGRRRRRWREECRRGFL